MKKFLFMLTVMIGIATGASAQKTDLSLSYGGYTQMDATDCHDGWHHVNNAWGALNVGVNFQVARNFYIGPSYTFSSWTGTFIHSIPCHNAQRPIQLLEKQHRHIIRPFGSGRRNLTYDATSWRQL